MPANFPMLRAIFNDDDEIIARLDECSKIKRECELGKDCKTARAVDRRIYELRMSLKEHILL